jgi:2'-5' RNA ligase
MHLTLHFIGEAQLAPIVIALTGIEYPAFSISIKGAGQFRTAAGIILWAGVIPSQGLSGLHAQVGKRLALTGVTLEPRPYRPHITLARCGKGISEEVLTNYLSQHEPDIPNIGIHSFSLYSSTLSQKGSSYQQEKSYPLA